MKDEQIKDRLQGLFSDHRVIFWNDANREFEDFVSELSIDGVEILRPDRIGQLKTKVIIELERPQDKFIVYAPSQEPGYEDDWLLDIRLYSYQFHADRASMIVEELGLQHHFLRDHISKRAKFFNSKERLDRLKKVIAPSDLEDDIDRKILCVLVRSEGDNFCNIVNALFSAINRVEKEPEPWEDIVKYDVEEAFWNLAREYFGYGDDVPSLQKLLCCIFITDLYANIGDSIGAGLRQFLLPAIKQANAVVCLNNWRDSVHLAQSYDRVACIVEGFLGVEKHISNVPHDALMDSVTFAVVEKMCAGHLKELVLAGEEPFNAEGIRENARRRQDMYWANSRMMDTQDAPRSVFYALYESIIHGAKIIELRNEYRAGFAFDSPKEGFNRYTQEFYEFDRAYRGFYGAAGVVDEKGWDALKELKEKVEDIYSNSFLDPLALAWEKAADLSSWRIDGIYNQYDFWTRYPKREMGDKNSTVYVIISDGFRYEAARELLERLNSKYRFSARLDGLLGCVPSYTALGMAALLPHESIGINEKGDVILDGKACASTQQRSQILEKYGGLAIQAKELMELSRDEARDRLRDRNVVYIYHNTIDSTGSDEKTETNTFMAVGRAMDELEALVSRLVNDLNPKWVFVTADHGFVYKQRKPDDINIYKVSEKSDIGVKVNKRYLIGEYIPNKYDAHQGKLSNTSGVSKDMDMHFLIPRGMSLFYLTGGARFFHGGMSLQEVVVPVITVEQLRGKEKDKTRERTVAVQVLGAEHRITTGRHRFQFLQLEAVTERVRALTVKMGIYDENTAVSDIHTVSFESASDDMSQRSKDVVFTLQNVTFDRKKTYRLILRDAATDREIMSLPVRIDRAFTADF